ncbi:hypothetical protein ABIA38_004878 [Embleya sp. AB8]
MGEQAELLVAGGVRGSAPAHADGLLLLPLGSGELPVGGEQFGGWADGERQQRADREQWARRRPDGHLADPGHRLELAADGGEMCVVVVADVGRLEPDPFGADGDAEGAVPDDRGGVRSDGGDTTRARRPRRPTRLRPRPRSRPQCAVTAKRSGVPGTAWAAAARCSSGTTPITG